MMFCYGSCGVWHLPDGPGASQNSVNSLFFWI